MMQRRWERSLSLLVVWILVIQWGFFACECRRNNDKYPREEGVFTELNIYSDISRLIKKSKRFQADDPDNFKEEDIRQWVYRVNEEMRRRLHLNNLAAWNLATNITDETEQKSLEESTKFTKWLKSIWTEGRLIRIERVRSADLKRQFRLIMTTMEPSDDRKSRLIHETQNHMASLYNTAEVCLDDDIIRRLPDNRDGNKRCLALEPDLSKVMVTSRDPEVLKAVWKGWRDVAGKPQRARYEQFVKLLNEGATENGYKDAGEFYRQEQFPDNTSVEEMADDLWKELRPFYLLVHAFVRRKLREHYGSDVVGTDGTIRADLLGNMWGQEWQNVYPLVAPYSHIPAAADMDTVLKEKYDVIGLFRLAEQFYASVGLFNMTDTFWKMSMFTRPKGREVQCHASAADLKSSGDFRIKMCSEVNRQYLETIHHEMGHVEYSMAYEHQPTVYREGANSAFHEAIGDTIALSVMSITHLQRLGLLSRSEDGSNEDTRNKKTINTLMMMALKKIAFLPFGLVVEKWRWQVFDGTTPPDNYNRAWWNLRLNLQGLKPPVTRSEEDFDPAAKFHVADNSPYICYFVSHVLQFQFYKQLCKLSGHQGPLHLCDIQGSLAAGEPFKELLSAGSSRPWQDVLQEFTGSRHPSASAITEYFQPLLDWLKKDNAVHNEKLGWEGATLEHLFV